MATTYYDRGNTRVAVTDNAEHVHPEQLAGERNPGTANQYGVAVPECNYTSWAHGDGDTIVTSSPALLFGILVNVAITGEVTVRDGTTAGGVLIQSTGAAAVNTFFDYKGIKLDDGIFLDDAASAGNVIVMWRAQ